MVTTCSADDGVNASLDDGLADQNASPSITINGGIVKVYADADGLDSNGNLIIIGGMVVGIGSGGMLQIPTVGQGWVQQNVMVKAQDRVKVTDSNDAEVVSLMAEQAATSLFVSTPQITEGQTYKVTSGSVTAELVAGENAQGGFGPGPGGVGGPGSGGSNDLGVVPPENGGLRAPALTGSSRRGEINQPTGGSSS
jgi:putative lipoprotein